MNRLQQQNHNGNVACANSPSGNNHNSNNT
jgi:hypothetical protein